ncbi:ATP-binding protein [Stygiobacter electus]|uniref:histidine kinase n=1 Tax=Stygiobacter electus TaxID=3032292 RepID=A0AAE3P1X6_9BACT|nr:ATP-binding protein [Stygiobacter electus]MDF1612829.1 ATP-binding protein [Stygiobacter electus]
MENQLMISLSRNKLLKNVEINKIDLRNIRGKLITIGEGEILYREGDHADGIFLVVSGEINLLKKRLLGKSKSFIFSEDDFFGQEEYLEETSRTSTAVALRDSYLIFLSKDEIDILIRQDDKILQNLRETFQEPISEAKTFSTIISDTKEEIKEQKIDFKEEEIKTQEESHEFFQSISDSSRSGDENLVHPLEKIESKIEKTPEENLPFDESLFNEDGIIKAEFEIPTEKTEEQKSKVIEKNAEETAEEKKVEQKPKDDLDDALFAALSGFTATQDEKKEMEISEENLSDQDDQSFYASMEDFEPKIPDEKLNEFKIEEDKIKKSFEEKTQLPEDEKIIEEAQEYINPLKEEIIEEKIETVKQTFEETKGIDLISKDEIKKTDNHEKQTNKLTTDELEMLLRAAELVNSTIKVDEVLQNIVTVAIQITNADRGTLYIVDKEKNELWSLILQANELKEIRLKIGEGLAGYSAKKGEVLNIRDVQNDPRFNNEYDRVSGYVTKSMICFPIKNNQAQVIGVLQLINSKNGFFTERDETFLAALSVHAALALQNAELVEKLLQGERVNSLGKMANFLIQDIKKPILVSKRYAEHLLSKNLQPEISQIVQMLLDQITHIVDLVQTTSSYSEGKTVLRTINASLNNTLADFATRIENFVNNKNCKIINEFDKDVTVRIDMKELYQSYFHIIRNACDAMPEGGTIHISTKREEKKVKILVKDNGIGIPDSIKEKIFDPFVSYGKKDGTGLGLPIAKKIIEAHNGKIEFDSAVGIGTTFIITLPIASIF